MPFYALIAADSDFAIDIYPTAEQAATSLRDCISDEPAFADLLRIVTLELDRRRPGDATEK